MLEDLMVRIQYCCNCNNITYSDSDFIDVNASTFICDVCENEYCDCQDHDNVSDYMHVCSNCYVPEEELIDEDDEYTDWYNCCDESEEE